MPLADYAAPADSHTPWKVPIKALSDELTAADVLTRQSPQLRLADKTFLVTGASSGLGAATTEALAAAGARVFALVRSEEKWQTVMDDIAAKHPKHGPVKAIVGSLDSLDSVAAAGKAFLAKSSQLNALICNAGIGDVKERQETKDGFELTIGTNHIGHFLLFQYVLPVLLSSSSAAFQSRVVAVSSTMHSASDVDLSDMHFTAGRQYDPMIAYGQSKTANILFANEVERRYGSNGLHAWSLHPFPSYSHGLERSYLGPDNRAYAIAHGVFSKDGAFQLPLVFGMPEHGAAIIAWAAVDGSLEGKGGKYLEDMTVAKPKPEQPGALIGYAPHAYNEQKAAQLWEWSEEQVKAHLPMH